MNLYRISTNSDGQRYLRRNPINIRAGAAHTALSRALHQAYRPGPQLSIGETLIIQITRIRPET